MELKAKKRTVPFEKRDVMLKSGETFAAAWFFVPEQARAGDRMPAVAMAHGFGAVKEMHLEPFVYTARHAEGFARQPDQDSYHCAHGASAPAWRNQIAMSSLEALLEHAPGRFIDLVAPRPLLMILARNDAITPPESIRSAFARAGEPKRLLEIDGGHYAIYTGRGADETGQAATEWFTEHLAKPSAPPVKTT
jgi:pimeloyl-ACP methyl ester carboxylesterase